MRPKPGPLTSAEYLVQEHARTVKCEYVDGEIHAMAGASRRLNLIVSTPDDVVESSCLELTLSLEQIYEGVTLPSRIEEPEELGYAEIEQ